MDRPLVLGRYRLLATSGAGASGTVEIAYDTRIQRKVAIKRIPLDDDPGKSAITEARTAAMLAHPNIVSVYDFEQTDTEAYLIMEYIEGTTLKEMVQLEDGLLSLDEIACVARSVSSALDYAHANQVLHLDIKPSNILIDRNGTVKVADFGMAELADAAGWHYAEGGTIGYMPPEQICADEDLDQRTDEWAFASVVYELIAGENPFLERDVDAALDIIEGGDILPPSIFRPELDPSIDAVLLDALSPSKDVRHDTMIQLARQLLPLLGDPDEGRARFASVLSEDPLGDGDEGPRLGLWDRIGPRGHRIIARIALASSGGWVAWLSMASVGLSAGGITTALVAVAAGALLVPALGAILAVAALTMALVVCGSPLLGAVTAILGLAWWSALGRRDATDAAMPLVAPALALLRLLPLFPMVSGFRRGPLTSTVAAAFGFLLVIDVCALTGADAITEVGFLPGTMPSDAMLLELVSSPHTLMMLAGWIVSTLLMSLLCSRGSRIASLIGSVSTAVVLYICDAVARYIDGVPGWLTPSLPTMGPVIASMTIMCLITALGAPYQDDVNSTEE